MAPKQEIAMVSESQRAAEVENIATAAARATVVSAATLVHVATFCNIAPQRTPKILKVVSSTMAAIETTCPRSNAQVPIGRNGASARSDGKTLPRYSAKPAPSAAIVPETLTVKIIQ